MLSPSRMRHVGREIVLLRRIATSSLSLPMRTHENLAATGMLPRAPSAARSAVAPPFGNSAVHRKIHGKVQDFAGVQVAGEPHLPGMCAAIPPLVWRSGILESSCTLHSRTLDI